MQFNKTNIWIFEKLFAVVFLSIFCTFFTHKCMMTVHAETHYTKELANQNVGFDPLTGTLKIPDGITEIDNYVFYGRQDIKRVVIPNSVTKIGQLAFFDCGSLKEVNLPESLEIIGVRAFGSCCALEKIVIPDKVKNISTVFIGCRSLKEVVLPRELDCIGFMAFHNCPGLEKINIPNRLKIIDAYAFERCAIKDITLPSSVYLIKKRAFADSALRNINISENLNIEINDTCRFKDLGCDGHMVIDPYAFAKCTGNINIGDETFLIDKFIKLYS